MSQLRIFFSEYDSEENCFEHSTEQPVVVFVGGSKYKSLGEYQRAEHQDLLSHERDCGPLPEKLDVIRLHKGTMGYSERAREILRKSRGPESPQ